MRVMFKPSRPTQSPPWKSSYYLSDPKGGLINAIGGLIWHDEWYDGEVTVRWRQKKEVKKSSRQALLPTSKVNVTHLYQGINKQQGKDQIRWIRLDLVIFWPYPTVGESLYQIGLITLQPAGSDNYKFSSLRSTWTTARSNLTSPLKET